MKLSYMFACAGLASPLIALGLTAVPVSAQGTGLSHPTSICVEQGMVANIGDEAVDTVLAAAGLIPPPTGFEEKVFEIVTSCVLEHGEPDMENNLLGRYAGARAMKEEAQARLVAAGMDMDWLNATLEVEGINGESIAIEGAQKVWARIALARPDGYGIDVLNGSVEDRTLGILVYAYISGKVEVERISDLMAQ